MRPSARWLCPPRQRGHLQHRRAGPCADRAHRDDPRWSQALPVGYPAQGTGRAMGLSRRRRARAFNVVLPLLILRLAAGAGRYSVRALMALPVAAAMPLIVFLRLEPVLPVSSSPWLASERRLFSRARWPGFRFSFARCWQAVAWRRSLASRSLPSPRYNARLARHGSHLVMVRHEVNAVDRAYGWRGWHW